MRLMQALQGRKLGGLGIGIDVSGLRPVVVFQFSGFAFSEHKMLCRLA